MIFAYRHHEGRFAEVPSGTHGLYDSTGNTEIGKLISLQIPDDSTKSRDIWIFSGNTGFPSVFKMKAFEVPTKGVQTAVIYEYPDDIFKGTPSLRAIPDPTTNDVYQVDKGATKIGYLHVVTTSKNTDWYISTIDTTTGRIGVSKTDVLTFTKLNTAQGNYTCYLLQLARLTAM